MMPTELSFGAAVIVGLLGSSHCIGMCGGIVSALNLGLNGGAARRPAHLFVYHLAYNIGRVSSYVLVGLLAGSLGAGLVQLGLSPLAGKLLAAAFMIALGMYLANWWRGLALLERLGARLWRHIQPLAQHLLPAANPRQAFLLGLLWGWLPCGLVYAAVAWSLTAGNALAGATLMLGFGIGTLPALLLAGNAFNYLQVWVKSPLLRTSAGLVIIGFGVYGAISGLAQPHAHHAQTAVSPAGLQQPSLASTRIPASPRSMP